MTRCEALNAFRQVASEEFASIPEENEIEYEFSEKFNLKMQKVLSGRKQNTYTFSKAKKNVYALILAGLMLFAGLISVSAIREPIVEFIIEKYESFIEFTFSGDTSKQITHEYNFEYLPEGFSEIVYQVSEGAVYKEFLNEETQAIISLYQTVTDENKINLDNQQGEIITRSVEGKEVYIYKHKTNGYIQANWIFDTYSLILTYHGSISTEELIELIKIIE